MLGSLFEAQCFVVFLFEVSCLPLSLSSTFLFFFLFLFFDYSLGLRLTGSVNKRPQLLWQRLRPPHTPALGRVLLFGVCWALGRVTIYVFVAHFADGIAVYLTIVVITFYSLKHKKQNSVFYWKDCRTLQRHWVVGNFLSISELSVLLTNCFELCLQ